jgi:2-keto-3-deoxy-L-rhamnonate aldolase RhmA
MICPLFFTAWSNVIWPGHPRVAAVTGWDQPEIRAAPERIARAARAAGKAVSIFAGSIAEVKRLREIGASVIVYSSDQGFMRGATAKARDDIRALAKN